MNYAPLHVHSDASLDGAGTVQSLVAEASRLGMKHLALTDHGTLGNAVAFWSACDDAGIKPILGMEAYLLYNNARHHLTLLSLNESGFNDLVALNSWAHAENYVGGYPLVTMESLEAHSGDIYGLTGCVSSALYKGDMADATNYVADLMDVLGGSQFVGLETMFLGGHDTWSRPITMLGSKSFDSDIVVTNDTHYPCRNQFHAHQAICSARRGFTYDSQHLWLKSHEEILHEGSKFTDRSLVERGLRNTLRIAEKVEPWSMKAAPSLPHMPYAVEDLRVALKTALKVDVARKGGKEERSARLLHEWGVLRDKGFLDYIYILWDIVSWAKREGIRVGPGRGSGGGSYVLYLLGITTIDPLEYNLIFERFINPARVDYPDVDVDFESDRRGEVMEYASNRWDTIPIATYNCYSHKSAIHDVARTLHIPKDMEIEAADSERDSEKFETFMSQHEDALSTYNTMLGQIRHRGKHAAGVIIPNRPVPIERAPDGTLVAAWAEGMNTKDLSKVGIVKYDILGLTALSQLKKMAELTGVYDDAEEEWYYDDPNVFDLFCQGDVAGIFQWSGSEGIRDLTMRVAPRNFYDLSTCNALYRPGALDAGTAEQYPEFMKNPRKLHPRIDKHLEKTYGVICYQEQVMAVVAEVMGGSLMMADNARRLLSKAAVGDPKWEKAVGDFQVAFMREGERQGFDRTLVDQLWHEIYTHSGYSYNLAHAAAYTMISYQMAWYKVYHRAAFTVAVLQYDKANAQTYILDAIEHGLDIRMPHVNHSTNDYQLVGNTIYLPLSDINFLGDKAAEVIMEERKAKLFDSYADFDKRVARKQCNNRSRTMLERIGAFSSLDGSPSDAIQKYEEVPILGQYQNQLEVLGYVVPSRSLLRKIQAAAELPAKKGYTRFAGFISKVTKKKSIHGEYTVFTLSPSGQFWTREPKASFKVGAFITGTKSKFGHSIDAKVYRLDTGE
jgi:DNA polymerase-3 subunit alpha